jgi:pimeloyl-ACP methyl ester carboxylesterase
MTPTLFTSQMAYLDAGGAGPVLLCLHGIQGSKESFQAYADSPLRRAARLIRPDITGFGASLPPADSTFDLQRQAERIAVFLDELGIQRLFIYGHSLGGMLAILLLEQIPERIIGCICAEANLALDDCGESRRVAAMTFEEFKGTRFPQLKAGGTKADAAVFYETAKSVVQLSASDTLFARLTAARCPVLFLRGAESHFISRPVGQNIRLVEVPGTNHHTLPLSQAAIAAVFRFVGSPLAG